MKESQLEKRGALEISERQVKHDKFGMQLIEDTVIRPDGSEGKYFWVNFSNDAVLMFPLDNEGNLYLIREHAYALNKMEYAVPGGSTEPGESVNEAAQRETLEETGLEVEEGMGYLGKLDEISIRVKHETHLVLARVKSIGEASLESGEQIDLVKVPFEEAYQMALNGEITAATVVAGIYKIKDLIENLSELPPVNGFPVTPQKFDS